MKTNIWREKKHTLALLLIPSCVSFFFSFPFLGNNFLLFTNTSLCFHPIFLSMFSCFSFPSFYFLSPFTFSFTWIHFLSFPFIINSFIWHFCLFILNISYDFPFLSLPCSFLLLHIFLHFLSFKKKITLGIVWTLVNSPPPHTLSLLHCSQKSSRWLCHPQWLLWFLSGRLQEDWLPGRPHLLRRLWPIRCGHSSACSLRP